MIWINGWILLNVGTMPKILHYLIKVSTLLSNVRFSALFRGLEESAQSCSHLYLRLRNEFHPFSAKNKASDWLTQQVNQFGAWFFDEKWLEFISQSKIKGDYNFIPYGAPKREN